MRSNLEHSAEREAVLRQESRAKGIQCLKAVVPFSRFETIGVVLLKAVRVVDQADFQALPERVILTVTGETPAQLSVEDSDDNKPTRAHGDGTVQRTFKHKRSIAVPTRLREVLDA